MLIRLAISNLATIKSLALELSGGYTVLTGETGAGKSILIDAIRFVLGGKASPEQMRSGANQTLVEAVFDIGDQPEVRRLLNELDIPFDRELTLRRVLQGTGRSRALANDCAITQARLEDLGNYLVNIHGQHDNQMLLNPASHIEFLDASAGLLPQRARVAEAYAHYVRLQRERQALMAQAGERDRRMDELAFVIEELKAAHLQAEEEEDLRREYAVLTHAEQLAQLLARANETLYEGESPLIGGLNDVAQGLAQAAAIDPSLASHAEMLQPLRYQLEDLYQVLRSYAAKLEADPNRLEDINARLALLERLKRRYGGSVESALGQLDEAGQEMALLERSGESLETVERELGEVAGRLHALSGELSTQRQLAGEQLDRRVVEQLRELGMEKAEFTTRMHPLKSPSGKQPYYTAAGTDAVEFLLNTNPGQALRPLSRIASGGELSRTMLALKTVLAKADPTTTLIFDEVDAGISGRVAEIVGRKLRTLGETHQVLCVTHLPQIAALGRVHVRVSKITGVNETFTQAETLNERDKVREVARLLSGVRISDRTLASAEEMVNRAREASI